MPTAAYIGPTWFLHQTAHDERGWASDDATSGTATHSARELSTDQRYAVWWHCLRVHRLGDFSLSRSPEEVRKSTREREIHHYLSVLCACGCDFSCFRPTSRTLWRLFQKTGFVLKASPWHPNHVTICLLCHSGESLQNGQLELWRQNWYFAQETHKDTAISVWACQAGFWKSTGTSCQLRSKPHAVFHGVCKIALTEVLATQMGMMRHSKKVSSFELYKFNPLSPHCWSIARELVHCYTWGRLQIVTVCGNTVGRHS